MRFETIWKEAMHASNLVPEDAARQPNELARNDSVSYHANVANRPYLLLSSSPKSSSRLACLAEKEPNNRFIVL